MQSKKEGTASRQFECDFEVFRSGQELQKDAVTVALQLLISTYNLAGGQKKPPPGWLGTRFIGIGVMGRTGLIPVFSEDAKGAP
jgi:hypothetical protein